MSRLLRIELVSVVLELFQFFGRSLRLKPRLPLRIRHTVNNLSCLIIGYFNPPRCRFCAVPFRQTISAETRQVHQVNILHIFVFIKMLQQPSERSCFDFDLLVFNHCDSESTKPPRHRSPDRLYAAESFDVSFQ